MSFAGDGYVTDVPYVGRAYPAHAPAGLLFAATLCGVRVPVLEHGAVIWELGCGHANGLISAAAAHPDCRCVGVDFNPTHIAGARARASALGVDNVTLLEADFAALAADPVALPDADLVIVHGVYAWVGAETKAALRTLLRRHVRAGGLVLVSYNAMPGAAGMGLLQRALFEAARLDVGGSDRRLVAAMERVRAMRSAGAAHLTQGALLDTLFDSLPDADPAYLTHEYMNESWGALYHSEVAADLEDARLSFVGSAVPHEVFPALMLSEEQARALGDVPLPAARETLRDFFISRILRKDLFVRGPRRMTEPERDASLRDMVFCAASEPPVDPPALSVPAGRIELDPAYPAAARLLWDQGPQTLSALLAGPFADSPQTAAEAAALMVSAGLAWPCLSTVAEQGTMACRRSLTEARAAVEANGLQTRASVLAPRMGSEFPLGGLEVLVLDALERGRPADPAALAREIWAPFEARGEALVHDGEAMRDPPACWRVLRTMIETMLPERLPLWRALGMLAT